MAPIAPTGDAARMLELAGITADLLVTDAQTEAESLVTVAQARADAILEATLAEASLVAAELTRTREEQGAELDRERATTLAELRDEKAALETQISTAATTPPNHSQCSRQRCPSRTLWTPANAGEQPPRTRHQPLSAIGYHAGPHRTG